MVVVIILGMHFTKWKSAVPVFILILVSCSLPINVATAIPREQSPSITNLPAPVAPEKVVTQTIPAPTITIPWYSHPDNDPGLLGRSYGLLEISQAR